MLEDFKGRGMVEHLEALQRIADDADTAGSAENTVVVGGHLDSVRVGPGINDNASGVAALPERGPVRS